MFFNPSLVQASNAKEMEEQRAKAQEYLEATNKESEAGLAETVKKMEEETRVLLENQENKLNQLHKQREEELRQNLNLEKESTLNAAAQDFETKLSNELQKLAAEKDEREKRLLEELKESMEKNKDDVVASLEQRFKQEIADTESMLKTEKEKAMNALETELIGKHEEVNQSCLQLVIFFLFGRSCLVACCSVFVQALSEVRCAMLKEKEEALKSRDEDAAMTIKAELEKKDSLWQEKIQAQLQSQREEDESRRLREIALAEEEMAKKKDQDHELKLKSVVAELEQEKNLEVQSAIESTKSQLEEAHDQQVACLKKESESHLKEKEEEWMREADMRLESALGDLKAEHEQALETLKSELGGDLVQYKQTCAELEERMCGFKAAIDSEKEEVASLSERLHKKEEELLEAKQGQQKAAVRYESEMVALKEEIQLMRDSAGKNDEARMNQLSQKCRDVEMAKSKIEILQQKIDELTESNRRIESALLDSEQTRRVLHNTIQELRGNVRVFCRIRPSAQEGPGASVINPVDDNTGVRLAPHSTSNPSDKQQANSAKQWSFGFDRVFDQKATQEDVFLEVEGLVQSALDGYKVS